MLKNNPFIKNITRLFSRRHKRLQTCEFCFNEITDGVTGVCFSCQRSNPQQFAKHMTKYLNDISIDIAKIRIQLLRMRFWVSVLWSISTVVTFFQANFLISFIAAIITGAFAWAWFNEIRTIKRLWLVKPNNVFMVYEKTTAPPEALLWLKKLGYNILYEYNVIIFRNKSDAALFKLKWL